MDQYRFTGYRLLPPIVKNLLIINTLMYFFTIYAYSSLNIDLTKMLGLHSFDSQYFNIYQFVTYMFMHGSFSHLFFNMFALWMFGAAIENYWGPKRFLYFYFIVGISAGLFNDLIMWISHKEMIAAYNAFAASPDPKTFLHLVKEYFPEYIKPVSDWIYQWDLHPDNSALAQQAIDFLGKEIYKVINVPMVGASGAIFGLLLAFGMLFPNALIYIYFLFPMKAKYFVLIYGAMELFLGVMNEPGDNVAHFAHLGGMIFGFILIKYWQKKDRNKYFYS